MLLLHILRYIMTNGIVLGCGFWFEWFYVDNLLMVMAMVQSFSSPEGSVVVLWMYELA